MRRQSPLRSLYDALHALEQRELTAIAQAHADDPSPLVRRFKESVKENDLVTTEPFHPGQRADPGDARYSPSTGRITSTIAFARLVSDGGRHEVAARPELAFRYVDREISPLRTIGSRRSARRSLDLLLVNADDRMPILAELKIGGDKPSYFALIQILALAADLLTGPQLRRLRTHYPDAGFVQPNSGPYVDLYIVAHDAPIAGKYRPQLLDATHQIISGLNTDPEFTGSVRRIAYLTSTLQNDRVAFAHTTTSTPPAKPAVPLPAGEQRDDERR